MLCKEVNKDDKSLDYCQYQMLTKLIRIRIKIVVWESQTYFKKRCALLWTWRIHNIDLCCKEGDGKTKLDHVHDMLDVLVNSRKVAFSTVLMDSWYTSKPLMLFIESLGKKYYCPIKKNRLVDDSNGTKPYQRIDSLESNRAVRQTRQTQQDHKVKVFRVAEICCYKRLTSIGCVGHTKGVCLTLED